MIEIAGGRVPIKAWVDGVPIEEEAKGQLRNVANLPVVGPHVAVMPDVHWGMGATVGSVIPTQRAIIPAAVGVDIGCGMMAVETDLNADDVRDRQKVYEEIIRAVPVGGPGIKGSWEARYGAPSRVTKTWEADFEKEFQVIRAKHPKIKAEPTVSQLATLGTGNHFVEICHDPKGKVWVMLHSGSRGVGNRIGTYFIEKAKEQAYRENRTLKIDANLSWLADGTQEFADYVQALRWAQRYARANRHLMMDRVLVALTNAVNVPFYVHHNTAVNCHHNYVEERPNGLYITRKGAVSAKTGELGIIPGSMGRRSYIVRGLGNPESFESCSHGAGRVMSRGRAKKEITVEEHVKETEGVVCRKDVGVIDESPRAYKSIDDVMAAQRDLVEVVTELRQFVCVKG